MYFTKTAIWRIFWCARKKTQKTRQITAFDVQKLTVMRQFHELIKWNRYSKASSYTALSYTGLGDARLLIGSKILWNTRIYVVKTLYCIFFPMILHLPYFSNSSYTNFELQKFFHSPQKRASQGLTVNKNGWSFCYFSSHRTYHFYNLSRQ